ncbi:hypothetical protein E1262_20425 [Jiangella aurantiaca]|uniref:CpsD/CapB family tyrosine-protein kinase n=1 Tax=Jiangella aurantiaca TaxID=2530373 RepID=A0A4R5A506_9ACTN|nr:hypothetical protein [Jiangella aurantiaca]TDD66991.1 hypothetical protein E1262_20425 [Jiangella aurantiaca]
MTVLAFTSVRGAPGVTTTALVAALAWPRPVLLVEADVTGSSSIKAGHLRGEVDHELGLINLALAHRNGALSLSTLRGQTIALTEDGTRLALPGLATKAQAASLTDDFWATLATLLRSVTRHGVDVIVDGGRFGMRHGPDALLKAADLLAVVCRTALDDLVAVRANADQLPDGGCHGALGRRGLLLVGEARPHRAGEAAEATTLPVWATVDWDPVAAERLNGRERLRTTLSRLMSSRLIRSGRNAVAELLAADDRRRRLDLSLETTVLGGKGVR